VVQNVVHWLLNVALMNLLPKQCIVHTKINSWRKVPYYQPRTLAGSLSLVYWITNHPKIKEHKYLIVRPTECLRFHAPFSMTNDLAIILVVRWSTR